MLEIMHYINETNLKLDDIEKCTIECGYKCQKSSFLEPQVNVLFEKSSQEHPQEYCRFIKIVSEISQLEPDEVETLLKAKINVTSIITIEYNRKSLQLTIKLLQCILQCYNGWLLLQGKLYNEHNINEILFLEFD